MVNSDVAKGSMNSILIVGLFLSKKNKHKIQRTPADQLAELFVKNGLNVITVSSFVSRILRLIDTVSTIFFKHNKYSIAIVPFYGGFRSYIWEEITVFLLHKLRKKIILIVHGGGIPERMKIKSTKYLRTMNRADYVVCPSGYLIKELADYNQPSILIENVVNLSDYHFHYRKTIKPKILWMRAFEYPYNPLMAIKVFTAIKQKYPEALMVMAGYDQGMLQETKELAKELLVIDSIEFPGYINNEQKNRLAKEFDIYLCTNKIDNAPISFVEMMALGLPIVTVNSGGIPFLVKNNYDCLMVNDDDIEGMAQKILFLIDNPEKAIELINNARASTIRFDEKAVMRKWQAVLNELSN